VIPFLAKDHHWLNNNHFSPIRYEGYVFPTVWHAYIAAKTSDARIKREIAAISVGGQLSSVTARVVQQIGFDAPETMENLLKIKFGLTVQDINLTTQMRLAKKLIHTGLQILEFGNHTCETEWGVCYCSRHTINSDLEPVRSSGNNLLGKLLMQIRDIWRVYIEEVNVISTVCGICSKPAEKNVLYTPTNNPTFPSILETCLSCQSQAFIYAHSHSSDQMVIDYNPNEKQEDPKVINNIIVLPDRKEREEGTQITLLNIIKKVCPSCYKLTPTSQTYCSNCFKYIGYTGSKSSSTPTNYQSPYQPPPAPPDRQFNSEEIIC
jgi:predicted NAD-dependent protein-ADP-ribosyltransferase YbiA (DUF1768 family)